MQPFKINGALAALKGTYPDPSLVLEAAKEGQGSCESIARLWISEGIPFAFRKCPALYDEIRCWLGWKLGVSPKQISMTGSARIGKSLAPHKFGKEFDSDSDLDLFVVCEDLFGKVTEDFRAWERDYKGRSVHPGNDNEKRHWNSNLEVCQETSVKDLLIQPRFHLSSNMES